MLAAAVLVTGLARMLWITSAVTLLTIVLLVAMVRIKLVAVDRPPGRQDPAAGVSLAQRRWIFETRPDLPSTVVVAGGSRSRAGGPESVRNVVVATDRVHSMLTGLLAGL